MFTTNKQLLCCKEALNHGSEFKISWDTFDRRSQNFGLHMIARSQLIAGSRTIADACFHMIADDRRTFCDLRSAIRDRLRSYGNQPLCTTNGERNTSNRLWTCVLQQIRLEHFEIISSVSISTYYRSSHVAHAKIYVYAVN